MLFPVVNFFLLAVIIIILAEVQKVGRVVKESKTSLERTQKLMSLEQSV